MFQLLLSRIACIMECSTGCNNGSIHLFNSKTFQRNNIKMFLQDVMRIVRLEYPLIQCIVMICTAILFQEFFLPTLVIYNFTRCKILDELIYLLLRSLAH